MEIKFFESNTLNVNETEKVFREKCPWNESEFSDQLSSQGDVRNYHKDKSLYLLAEGGYKRTQLIVYDTEKGIEIVKTLKNPVNLSGNTSLILLPNDELLLFLSFGNQEVFKIDRNYSVKLIQSDLPLFNSSAIYFKENVYCFVGRDRFSNDAACSKKFDLKENQWVNITPMPKGDFFCHSVVFNGNILISGYYRKTLLLYSVEIDSFSTILYEFSWDKRKILIIAERLYIIECSGFIYESENEYDWNKISHSVIQNNDPSQIYWVENKGKIYILAKSNGEKYFEFDLKQKTMTKIL